MTIADQAIDNAIPCEMVKYAYRQTKDGIVVSFVVHPNDVPAALAISRIGARYMVALVELNDDETPKEVMPNHGQLPERPNNARPRQETQPQPDGAKGRMDWREVQPAAQAGIRCNDSRFMIFLKEEYPNNWRHCIQSTRGDIAPDYSLVAAQVIRDVCGVHSRSEFSTDHRKRVLWHQLDSQFQAWQAKERVGA